MNGQDGLSFLSQIHGEKCWPTVEKSSPCEDACPLRTDVPSYVMALAQGKFKEALAVVREVNALPSVCGRVCHHPCEEACNRAIVDAPVAIAWLKRVATDYGSVVEEAKPKRLKKTKRQKVAVVGAGPAGLSAAYFLARAGYPVTVYEAASVAGGVPAIAIPDFILPKEVIKADVDYLRGLGLEIRPNHALGKDITLESLKAEGYKAAFVAIGAWRGLILNLPGVDLPGVFPTALDFLKEAKLGKKPSLLGKTLVIGGGNVAIDAARTALRLGAKEVHLACLESRPQMPAFAWEVERAEKEGVVIHNALAPQAMARKDGRKVGKVDFKRVSSVSFDSEGRIMWTTYEGPGSQVSLEADNVIIAIGQGIDPSALKDSPLEVTQRGTIKADPVTLQTSLPWVFAGGDVVTGPKTIVEALGQGKEAANSIDRYLQRQDLYQGRPLSGKVVFTIVEEKVPGFLVRKERWEMPALPVGNRVRDFSEVLLGYPVGEGVAEASRCLNCRMCGNCIFERDQLCYSQSTRLLT